MDKTLGEKRISTWVCITFILLFFFFVLLPAQKLKAESLVEEAKKEGKVMLYSGMVIPDIQAIATAFHKKYPFIQVDFFRAGGSRLYQKILIEKRAGRNVCDVIQLVGLLINSYKKEGILGKYVSPECKAYPPGYKDPEGYWASIYSIQHVFNYNTRLVDRAELPKNYEDILNPRWKGKIGISDDEYEWYIGMLDLMGEEKGRQYMRRLATQGLRVYSGRTLVCQLMAAGEFPIALNATYRLLEMQRKGAPVAYLPLPQPTLATPRAIGLDAKAPHPHAARLLIDFYLSREGQAIIKSLSHIPDHPEIAKDPALEALKLKPLPIKPRAPEVVASNIKEFQKLLMVRH